MEKVMKRFCVMVLLLVLSFSLTGCGEKMEHIDGSLEEIMDKLYEGIDNLPNLEYLELNSENMEHFVGTIDIDYESGLTSNPIIGSIAHSVVLFRAKENGDVEKMKEQIKEHINPRRWICVWVEDEDVIIKSKGDLVIAILIKEASIREAVSKNFDNL